MNDLELCKLHLKQYHMTPSQFRRRTDQLHLPKEIYDKYDSIVKTCKICASRKPAPQRSRISGLRASEFGDLVFIEHTELKLSSKNYLVFIVLDAATSLVWAIPTQKKTAQETMKHLKDWMDILIVARRLFLQTWLSLIQSS